MPATMKDALIPVLVAAVLSLVGWIVVDAMTTRELRGSYEEQLHALDDRMSRMEDRNEAQFELLTDIAQRISDRLTILEREYGASDRKTN